MTLGKTSSGTYIDNSILRIIEEQDFVTRLSYFTCNYFKDYPIKMIHHDDLDSGLIELFTQLFDIASSGTSSTEHREFILKFRAFIIELNKYVSELFTKWFTNVYTSHLPIPKFCAAFICTKRSIELVRLTIRYMHKETRFVTNQDYSLTYVDDTWSYKYTELLNIIVTNKSIDNLTPRGVKTILHVLDKEI